MTRRWPSRSALALGLLFLWPLLLPAGDGRAQSGWASEPTYRYAGAYHGEWVSTSSEVALASEAGSGIVLFTSRPASVRGIVDLEVACDGTVRLEARGHTDSTPTYAALVSTALGLRLVDGRLDLAARATLAGRLSARRAEDGSGYVEAALEEAVSAPATAAGTGGVSLGRRWHAADSRPRWQLLAGEPGRLQGTWDSAADLAIPGAAGEPALRLGARGSWSATRHSTESCPWRGQATARGAVVEGQMHEESVEFVFRLTADGRLEGEGSGRARVYGGVPGGCEFSGGGMFSVRVGGEYRAGRFRVQLTDDEQPQLLVTTTCPSGQYVAPQTALATAFGTVELAEAPGARGQSTAGGTASGVLEVGIEPLGELAPP